MVLRSEIVSRPDTMRYSSSGPTVDASSTGWPSLVRRFLKSRSVTDSSVAPAFENRKIPCVSSTVDTWPVCISDCTAGLGTDTAEGFSEGRSFDTDDAESVAESADVTGVGDAGAGEGLRPGNRRGVRIRTATTSTNARTVRFSMESIDLVREPDRSRRAVGDGTVQFVELRAEDPALRHGVRRLRSHTQST
jgi:hypothetical protein